MIFGASIKLSNKSEFIKGLLDKNKKIKLCSAEVRLASVDALRHSKSMESQQTHLRKLGNLLEEQKNKYNLLKNRLYELTNQRLKDEAIHKQIIKSYEEEKEKLTQLETTLGVSSSKYQAQLTIVNALAEKVKINTQNYQANGQEIDNVNYKLTNANTAMLKTENAIRKVNDQLQKNIISAHESTQGNQTLSGSFQGQERHLIRLQDKYKESNKNIHAYSKNTKKATEDTHAFSGGLSALHGALMGVGAAITMAVGNKIKDIGGDMLRAGMDFEASMSEVEAISGATGVSLKELTDKALELGKTTKFMGFENAQALKYMGMAGWAPVQSLAALDGVLNLAALSNEDLARTSDIVTDTLSSLKEGADQTTRFVDVMGATAANSNTNISLMGETFKYVAPIAGTLSYKMEDLALMTGLLANNGIKGEKAGVAMRNIFLRLLDPTDKVAEEMNRLGIRLKDSQGNIMPLIDFMQLLREKLGGLSEAEKVSSASILAGKEATAALLSVVNAAPGDFTKLKTAIDDSSGAGKRMADTMLNNGKGAITILKSNIEGLQIDLYMKLKPAFMEAVKCANGLVNGFSWLVKHGRLVAPVIGGIVTSLLMMKPPTKIFQLLGSGISAFVKNLKNGALGLREFGVLFNTITTGSKMNWMDFAGKVGGSIATIGSSFGNILSLATLVGGAVWGLVEAQNAYMESFNKADEWIIKESEKLQENVKAWDDVKQAQEKAINSGFTEMTKIQVLSDELKTLVNANGEVKEGYESRVKFITEELTKALGTEITLNKGVIKNYTDIASKIDTIIKKKKAKVLLDAQEDGYSTAVKELSSAMQDYNKKQIEVNKAIVQREGILQKINQLNQKAKRGGPHSAEIAAAEIYNLRETDLKKADANLEKLKDNANDAKNLVTKYQHEIMQFEKNQELFSKGHYDKMTNIAWEYVQNAESVSEARVKQIQQQIDTERDNIKGYNELYEKTQDENYKKQAEDAEKRISTYQAEMQMYISTVESSLKDVNNLWDENTINTLNTLTGKTWLFKEDGQGHIIAYANGIEQKTGTAAEVSAFLVDEVNKELQKGEGKATEAGRETGSGFAVGIDEQQNSIFNAGVNLIKGLWNGIKSQVVDFLGFCNQLAKDVLSCFTVGFDEHSPSKKAFTIGKFFTQGLINGISDDANMVIQQAGGMAKDITRSLQTNLVANKLRNVQMNLSSDAESVFDNKGSNISLNTLPTKGNVLNEADEVNKWTKIFTAVIYKMKDNFEIKLNGERIGELVEKRIDNIIYR